VTEKARLNHSETPCVSRRYCADCKYGRIHETGSLIWVSCRFQQGWRSVSSQCNLPDSEFLKFEKEKQP